MYNIDILSLLLSGAQVKNNKGVYKDINGDGYMDLLVHFYTNQIQIPSSQDYLELTGMTTEDCHLIGSDKIQKVSKNRENHTRDKE